MCARTRCYARLCVPLFLHFPIFFGCATSYAAFILMHSLIYCYYYIAIVCLRGLFALRQAKRWWRHVNRLSDIWTRIFLLRVFHAAEFHCCRNDFASIRAYNLCFVMILLLFAISNCARASVQPIHEPIHAWRWRKRLMAPSLADIRRLDMDTSYLICACFVPKQKMPNGTFVRHRSSLESK